MRMQCEFPFVRGIQIEKSIIQFQLMGEFDRDNRNLDFYPEKNNSNSDC
jgi:hypothetical protein